MVMPLGPDFAAGLGIPTSRLGLIGASYTAAASVAGFAGSFFLDRFDRRTALAVAMLGLVLGTAAGGLATGLSTLMAARVFAGAFGGPATSVALSVIADVVPVERRGKAMGSVMGAFSIASVLGVPAGLELAHLGNWRTPFFAVAGAGLIVNLLALVWMPSMRGHLIAREDTAATTVAAPVSWWGLFRRPAVILGILAPTTSMMAAFSMVPNLSAYFQFNAGYPRESLGRLYLIGGAVSFFVLRVAGRLVDRFGAPKVSLLGTLGYVTVLTVGFIHRVPQIPILAVFVGFMLSNNFRQVSLSTTSSRVPSSEERARFMSIQSAVQHMASAIGAGAASIALVERPDHSLENMPIVASCAAVFALMLPFILWRTDMHLRRDKASAVSSRAPEASPAAVPETHV